MFRPTFTTQYAHTGTATPPRVAGGGGGVLPKNLRPDLNPVQQQSLLEAEKFLKTEALKAQRLTSSTTLGGFYSRPCLPPTIQEGNKNVEGNNDNGRGVIDEASLKWDLKAYVVEYLRYRNELCAKQQQQQQAKGNDVTSTMSNSTSSIEGMGSSYRSDASPTAGAGGVGADQKAATLLHQHLRKPSLQLLKRKALHDKQRKQRRTLVHQLLNDVNVVFLPIHAPKDGSGPLRVYEGTKNQLRGLTLWTLEQDNK
jgi:hypothetical protein